MRPPECLRRGGEVVRWCGGAAVQCGDALPMRWGAGALACWFSDHSDRGGPLGRASKWHVRMDRFEGGHGYSGKGSAQGGSSGGDPGLEWYARRFLSNYTDECRTRGHCAIWTLRLGYKYCKGASCALVCMRPAPWVHYTCMVTRRSSTVTSLVRKSAPIVALYLRVAGRHECHWWSREARERDARVC